MTDRRELEHLIAGIDEEISDARRDIKEAQVDGQDEVIRAAEQDIAALKDQRANAIESLNNLKGEQQQ